MTDLELTGIFLSDIPLGVNDGATVAHDTVLRVTLDIPESDLAERELVEEGKGYREWGVPAEIINQCGVVLMLGGRCTRHVTVTDWVIFDQSRKKADGGNPARPSQRAAFHHVR